MFCFLITELMVFNLSYSNQSSNIISCHYFSNLILMVSLLIGKRIYTPTIISSQHDNVHNDNIIDCGSYHYIMFIYNIDCHIQIIYAYSIIQAIGLYTGVTLYYIILCIELSLYGQNNQHLLVCYLFIQYIYIIIKLYNLCNKIYVVPQITLQLQAEIGGGGA